MDRVIAFRLSSTIHCFFFLYVTMHCLLGPCTRTSGKEKLSEGSLVCWHRGKSHTEVEEKEKGSARFPT